MKSFLSVLKNRILFLGFIGLLLVVIATGNQRETIVTDNINRTKSLEAIHIVTKYNNLLDQVKPVFANTFEEVIENGPNNPVSFVGTMTGYGPDCVGCGGRTGCPPRQDVRNGNIYYEDPDYGKIRIIATDADIPCGTVMKISNSYFSSEPILAIALDRGGAIQGKIVDLLFASEAETKSIGRQYNVHFEIVRWGW